MEQAQNIVLILIKGRIFLWLKMTIVISHLLPVQKNATDDDIQDLNLANETSQPLSNPTPEATQFSLPVNQNEFYQIMEDFRRSLDTSLEQTLSASLSKLT